jgi:hypothetical protein
MKKVILIILLLPLITFAQEKQQWTRELQNQNETKYYHFKLPSLEDELYDNYVKLFKGKERRLFHSGIRFTIKPSFDQQVTYEFFYNNFENAEPEQKKRIPEAYDLKYTLFRKYIISDESKNQIDRSYKSSGKPPDQLNIDVTDLYIKGLHQQIIPFEKRILFFFKDNPTGHSSGVTDGVTYIFEVAFGFGGFCKVYIHSPKEESEAYKILKDMQNLISSLQ